MERMGAAQGALLAVPRATELLGGSQQGGDALTPAGSDLGVRPAAGTARTRPPAVPAGPGLMQAAFPGEPGRFRTGWGGGWQGGAGVGSLQRCCGRRAQAGRRGGSPGRCRPTRRTRWGSLGGGVAWRLGSCAIGGAGSFCGPADAFRSGVCPPPPAAGPLSTPKQRGLPAAPSQGWVRRHRARPRSLLGSRGEHPGGPVANMGRGMLEQRGHAQALG